MQSRVERCHGGKCRRARRQCFHFCGFQPSVDHTLPQPGLAVGPSCILPARCGRNIPNITFDRGAWKRPWIYRHSYKYFDDYANFYGYTYLYANRYFNANIHLHRDAHQDIDSHRDCDTHQNSDAYTDDHTDKYENADCYTDEYDHTD